VKFENLVVNQKTVEATCVSILHWHPNMTNSGLDQWIKKIFLDIFQRHRHQSAELKQK
jgi:hypothetical protein